MIELKDIKKVYFIGIGGIGMSALARYFKFHGREVSGYDKTETPLTKMLVEEGIPVHYEDDLDIYGTPEAMEEAFIEFSGKLKPGGLLISKKGLSRSKDLKAANHVEYSLQDNSADVYADNIRTNRGSYIFNGVMKDWRLEEV